MERIGTLGARGRPLGAARGVVLDAGRRVRVVRPVWFIAGGRRQRSEPRTATSWARATSPREGVCDAAACISMHEDAHFPPRSASLFWVRLFGWRVAERDTRALALHASTLPTSRSPQFMLMVRDGARKSPHGARSTGREGRTHTSKRTALSLLLSRTLLLCAALGPCARRGRCREQYTSRRGLVHAPATS